MGRALRVPLISPQFLPARIVYGRVPQKNILILLEEKSGAHKSEKRRTFFFGVVERSEAVAGLLLVRNF